MYFHWTTFLSFPFLNSKFININVVNLDEPAICHFVFIDNFKRLQTYQSSMLYFFPYDFWQHSSIQDFPLTRGWERFIEVNMVFFFRLEEIKSQFNLAWATTNSRVLAKWQPSTETNSLPCKSKWNNWWKLRRSIYIHLLLTLLS